MKPLLIYNLFPRLSGFFHLWREHIIRAKKMGFNAIYINPIQYPGFSGSCYSIKDYYRIDDLRYVDKSRKKNAEEQFREIIDFIHENDMKLIMDLVINHTAIDSSLIHEHKNWYKLKSDGKIENPKAMEGDRVVAVWGDLAEIDNENSEDKKALWQYWKDLVSYYVSFDIDGFRCDAAYQVPTDLWKELIQYTKKMNRHFIWIAETLGCPFNDVLQLSDAGFDYVFNSSKYWDFTADWCLEQYEKISSKALSISFPESHDTVRLMDELGGNLEGVKQRYLFAAFFSSAILMPIGFEFGFSQKLDVVQTSPFSWEETEIDLTDFITKANKLKFDYQIFQNESPITKIHSNNEQVLILQKQWTKSREIALLILNKDIENYQYVLVESFDNIFKKNKKIKDISPEYARPEVPVPFDYHLRPGQVILLYQKY